MAKILIPAHVEVIDCEEKYCGECAYCQKVSRVPMCLRWSETLNRAGTACASYFRLDECLEAERAAARKDNNAKL